MTSEEAIGKEKTVENKELVKPKEPKGREIFLTRKVLDLIPPFGANIYVDEETCCTVISIPFLQLRSAQVCADLIVAVGKEK